MTTRVLIVLDQGPDIRQFVQSGLAKDIAHEATVVWALGPHWSSFSTQGEAVPLAEIVPRLPRLLQFVSRLADRTYHAREERVAGRARWLNFLDTLRSQRRKRLNNLIDDLLSQRLVHEMVMSLEKNMFRFCPVPRAQRSSFASLGVQAILLSDYGAPRAIGLLWIANRCGVRSVVVQNSWKDAYARAHVPVAPDVMVVPSHDSADLMARANSGLTQHILIGGSLHTAILAEPGRIIERGNFCARYGLDPTKHILCYSACAPSAVHNEPEIVDDLLSRLQKMPQLIVRLNPMEKDPGRWSAVADRPGVVLQIPSWDYVPKDRWNAPRDEDATIWASTIAHSLANISVPSTVTRDFLLFGKPVVNICFDLTRPADPTESLLRYWEATFYRCYRDDWRVTPTFCAEGLARSVSELLSEAPANSALPDPELASEARTQILKLVIEQHFQTNVSE